MVGKRIVNKKTVILDPANTNLVCIDTEFHAPPPAAAVNQTDPALAKESSWILPDFVPHTTIKEIDAIVKEMALVSSFKGLDLNQWSYLECELRWGALAQLCYPDICSEMASVSSSRYGASGRAGLGLVEVTALCSFCFSFLIIFFIVLQDFLSYVQVANIIISLEDHLVEKRKERIATADEFLKVRARANDFEKILHATSKKLSLAEKDLTVAQKELSDL